MKSNTDLEIFGSYEMSLTESKIITGHNKIKYVVGGNARYQTRSNIIEWNMVNKPNMGNAQVKVINDILQFPEYIDDREVLYHLLQEVNKLPDEDFFKLLENSLNLKEALIIQLRRLFYIIDRMNTMQNQPNSITPNYVRPTEFCQYEPIKRISILLEAGSNSDTDQTELYNQIKPLVDNFERLVDKKNKLFTTLLKYKVSKQKTTDISSEMNKFIEKYLATYDVLHKIELSNVMIAQSLETILNLMEI